VRVGACVGAVLGARPGIGADVGAGAGAVRDRSACELFFTGERDRCFGQLC
jgi:hypothetical protein